MTLILPNDRYTDGLGVHDLSASMSRATSLLWATSFTAGAP